MAVMVREPSVDERFLAELAVALDAVGLEVIVVGATAAVLQGAPVMTQDVVLLVRSTRRNEVKIRDLATALGGSWMRPSPLSTARTLVGAALQVDLLFDVLPGGLRFESLKARALRITLAGHEVLVAQLDDVIASKRAANRPKDLLQLPVLEDTARVLAALGEDGG